MYFAIENTSEPVCVDIIEGSLADNRNVSVMLESMDMTATGKLTLNSSRLQPYSYLPTLIFYAAPNDYEAVSQELVFTHQVTASCVDVSVKEDTTLEGHELFILSLTSSDPSATLDPDEADVTIVPDDGMLVTLLCIIFHLRYVHYNLIIWMDTQTTNQRQCDHGR